MEKAENMKIEASRLESAKAFSKVMGGELIEVKVQLFSPFVDFLKEYLAFFGNGKPIEDFCRQMIYEQLGFLHNELTKFADQRNHLLDANVWYWRFSHVACTAPHDEEEQEQEDC
jgi:hypothetical protein